MSTRPTAAPVSSRTLLLTGKGGVGKTTVAAATAVHLARRPGAARQVTQVCVLTAAADGLVRAVPAWSWDGSAESGSAGSGHQALDALLAHP